MRERRARPGLAAAGTAPAARRPARTRHHHGPPDAVARPISVSERDADVTGAERRATASAAARRANGLDVYTRGSRWRARASHAGAWRGPRASRRARTVDARRREQLAAVTRAARSPGPAARRGGRGRRRSSAARRGRSEPPWSAAACARVVGEDRRGGRRSASSRDRRADVAPRRRCARSRPLARGASPCSARAPPRTPRRSRRRRDRSRTVRSPSQAPAPAAPAVEATRSS